MRDLAVKEKQYPVEDLLVPRHVLVSLSDKSGLQELVSGLMGINPNVRFYSTSGTGAAIVGLLGDDAERNYTSVEQFTGFPEMAEGRVRTLHPKIHLGLLGHRNNPEHRADLENTMERLIGTPGVYFDILVNSLYPFERVIADSSNTPVDAMSNIDIGGPAMTMAAAKNWIGLATVTSPNQYGAFLQGIRSAGGISLEQRFALAQTAMARIAEYRTANAAYLGRLDFARDVLPHLQIRGK